MNDKSMDIFLMLLFGIGGVVIFILTWVQSMPLMERILSVLFGSVGIFWVLIHVLLRRPTRTRMDRTLVKVRFDSIDK